MVREGPVDNGQLAAAAVAAVDDFDSPSDFEVDDELDDEADDSAEEPEASEEVLDFFSPLEELLPDPALLSVR